MIQIKNRFTGTVILEGAFGTVAELISANSGSNLSYSDLKGSNLSYTDLKGSNLSYTDLSGSNLSYTDLSGSNLSYSDLKGSNLSYTDLSYSDIKGSNLSYTDLKGSNLSYTDLSGSNLSGSNLKGSNFSYTKSGDLIISAIYSIGPIGSRSDYLQCWAFDNGDRQYKTGCFSGTESEFIAAVSAHGIEKHKTDYMAAIAFFNAILEVQNNG